MDLLTKVIAETISKKCNDGSFGVSLINIPFVNYADLVSNINLSKKAEIFFLGFYEKEIESMELVERDSISFFIQSRRQKCPEILVMKVCLEFLL